VNVVQIPVQIQCSRKSDICLKRVFTIKIRAKIVLRIILRLKIYLKQDVSVYLKPSSAKSERAYKELVLNS